MEPLALEHGALIRQLGPDAGVVGYEVLSLDAGQILLNLDYRLREPRRVDGQVIGSVDPLDIRSEAHAAREIERQVRAEPRGAGFRSRVDEARDVRVRRRVGEVVALGVVQALLPVCRHDHVVDGRRAESGRVDESLGCDARRLPGRGVLDFNLPAFAAGLSAEGFYTHDGRVEGCHTASFLKQSQETHHESMRVDDTRGWTIKSTCCFNPLAITLHLFTAHPPRRNTKLILAQRMDLLKRLPLSLILRDDPLASAAVADVVLLAELVQQVLAADAQLRLEAGRAVVDARVDDLAVARARLGAHGVVALNQDGRVVAALRELPGYGEADDAATDNLSGYG